MSKSWLVWTRLGLRLLPGGVFLLSSVSKLPHHTEFEAVVKDYDLLPDALAAAYANALPWVELLVGVYLVLGMLVRPAAVLAVLMGLSFLVAQPIKYVPIGDKIELNRGPDPEVIFELVKLRVWRDNIWLRLRNANVYRRADEPGVKIEVGSTVAGWDDHAYYSQRIRNYTRKPIDVEVRRCYSGHLAGLPFDVGAQEHTMEPLTAGFVHCRQRRQAVGSDDHVLHPLEGRIARLGGLLKWDGVFREDGINKSIPRDSCLDNAPGRERGCFQVPKIIE